MLKFKDLIGKRLIGFQVDERDQEIMYDSEGSELPISKLLLFLGDDILHPEVVSLESQNRDGKYSWFTNWSLKRIPDDENIEMNSTYKGIGEVITSIWTEGLPKELLEQHNLMKRLYISRADTEDDPHSDEEFQQWKVFDKDHKEMNSLDTFDLYADPLYWAKAVDSVWNDGTAEKPYTFIKINTNTKILALGTKYKYCHYPDTIWEFL